MTYNQFLNYVKEQSIYKLNNPDEYHATINHVIKNNSIELDGICLHKNGEILSPTVYLNNFYEQYLEGRSLKSILGEILSVLHEDIPNIEISTSLFDNFEAIKPQVILRIVNLDKNSRLLETCPYIPFCDLAITFRWLVHQDYYGIASALITNRELEHWNITVEQLYNVAIENTIRIFPSLIRPMNEILEESISDIQCFNPIESDSISDLNIYVLTNESHINGSTCILYEDVLSDFAKQHNSDVYILPSSIHEVILVPTHFIIDEEAMLQLVYNANRTVVDPTDVLSDSVYLYDRKVNKIRLITDSNSK